jgi:hypothetical protein
MNDPIAGTGAPTTQAGEPLTTASTAANPAGTAPPVTPPVDAASSTEAKPTEPVAPESYELKMPEGIQLDSAAAEELTTIAKELKLDQANVQKLADIGANMAKRQAEAHAQLIETWTEQVKTDAEIGGDKMAENLGVARKAIDTFGTPALKDLLNSTGLGNHPEVVRLAFKFGKAISEDRFVTGSPKGPSTDAAKTLFPNMN